MLLTETNLVALLYLVLSGTYLLVLPALVYFYLSKRWYTASSIERLIMYLFVSLIIGLSLATSYGWRSPPTRFICSTPQRDWRS
ncbi:MAG: NAD(P)H-quinone oxidoreductase subunit L, partial [Cyanobacteria bacterium J06638_38]